MFISFVYPPYLYANISRICLTLSISRTLSPALMGKIACDPTRRTVSTEHPNIFLRTLIETSKLSLPQIWSTPIVRESLSLYVDSNVLFIQIHSLVFIIIGRLCRKLHGNDRAFSASLNFVCSLVCSARREPVIDRAGPAFPLRVLRRTAFSPRLFIPYPNTLSDCG